MPRHQLSSLDTTLIGRARQLLSDSIQARLVTSAQLISIAQVANVLARLPLATDAGVISISIVGPRHFHDDIETYFHWTISVEQQIVVLGCGGHFYRPSSGGDSFTTFSWASAPGEAPELQDYRDEHCIVPNIQSFMTGIPDLLTSPQGYRLSVEDENNPWLAEDLIDSESEESEREELDDVEQVASIKAGGWSIFPADEVEQQLAATVDASVVNARAPAFHYGIDRCGSCDRELSQCGLAVDGRLKGQVAWSDLCVPCFLRDGAGIGWGVGQLYAKQSSGEWRMVAGFR